MLWQVGVLAFLSLNMLAAGPVSGANDPGSKSWAHLDPQTIDAVADRVADWQLSTLDDLSYIRNPRSGDFDRRGWQHGALYVGLMRWADLPGNQRYLAALEQIAEENEWRLGDRLFHADDHVVGQLYLHLYGKAQEKERLEHTIAQLNQVMAAEPDGRLVFECKHIKVVGRSCQLRWCWCDALFMSPQTWMMLTLATGDEKYMAFADEEFWAAHEAQKSRLTTEETP